MFQRLMVAEELRSRGYDVIEAVSADEALSVLQSEVRVDLMFTDVRMSGTADGLGLARWVRGEYPAVKVLITSGHVARLGAGNAADGFFQKPYDIDKLVEHIEALLA